MGKKVGPNFEDENRIVEWAKEGKSVAFISDAVLVEEAAVKRTLIKHRDEIEAAAEQGPTVLEIPAPEDEEEVD